MKMHLGSVKKLSLACLLSLIPLFAWAQSEERPASDELLPETTVLYVQIENAREFVEKLADSNGGKMLADERIAPLAQELFQTAKDAYSEVEERVGLSLEELQSLPAGEVCLAVIAPKRSTPVFVLMLDTDVESEAVDKALDRGRELASEVGVEMETEEGEEVTFESFNVDSEKITYFRKGGTMVISNSRDELDGILTRWAGEEVEKIRPLKENRKFVTIMNRCRGTKDVPPDLRLFADPIKLAKSATRGQPGAQLALNFLPVLGLDGFLGIGGSIIINEMEFESVSHVHVLLSNPRAGVFEMLALKPGQYEPQPWVPDNAVAYVSTSWDVGKMYAELNTMFDAFSGEGALEEEIEDEINSELGIDFKEDFIDQLSGRVTYVQWVGEEIAINGQVNALGVGLEDPDKFLELVDIILEKIREENDDDEGGLQEVEYKGVTYWQMPDDVRDRQRERMDDREFGPPVSVRVPQPCFGIIDDHVIACDSVDFMKRAIDTARGKEASLYDDEQFQYVSRQMTRLLGTDVPGAVMYSRPEETMRMMFELARNDDTQGFLDSMAEENQYAASIRDALKDNPLPDFDEIKDYFPPSGGFITNDETGYHLLGFQLKSTVK